MCTDPCQASLGFECYWCHLQVQRLPRSLGRELQLTAPSQPDQMVPSAPVARAGFCWRWDITSDVGKPSAQAVCSRSGILTWSWHANEKKRCVPWLPGNAGQCLIDFQWSERLDVFLELAAFFVPARSKSNFALALCCERFIVMSQSFAHHGVSGLTHTSLF